MCCIMRIEKGGKVQRKTLRKSKYTFVALIIHLDTLFNFLKRLHWPFNMGSNLNFQDASWIFFSLIDFLIKGSPKDWKAWLN